MKQLALPALLAVLLHALAFGLHLPWTQPVLALPENRPVSITLETFQPEVTRDKPVATRRRVQTKTPKPPLKKLLRLRKPMPPPAPLPDPTPEPAIAQPPSKPVLSSPPANIIEPLPDHAANSPHTGEQVAPEADPFPDQAQIRESVPLYHLNPPPTYPALARRRNYQGLVVLDVLVDAQGRAAQVKVDQSSGHLILDQSAVRSVSGWRFEPARRGDQTVEMWVKVPVRFVLH